MENLYPFTEVDAEVVYTWGTAVVRIEGTTLIIEDGVITAEDESLWAKMPAATTYSLRRIEFQNAQYTGSMNNMFNSGMIKYVETIDLSGLDTTEAISAENMFTEKNTHLKKVTFGDEKSEESAIKSTHNMFYKCINLEEINLDGLDLTNNTDMSNMFYSCQRLNKLSWVNLNTSNVTNMSGLFIDCIALKVIDLDAFETHNVTNMSKMFYGAMSLEEVSIDSWDTSKVTTMNLMFASCESLQSISMAGWKNQPVLTSTESMFYTNKSLTSLDMTGFDTSSVTTMRQMFVNCGNLTVLDVSSFDTTNVTNYDNMFRSMNQLRELNISSFNMHNATTMTDMLAVNPNLKKITLGPNVSLNESTNLPTLATVNEGAPPIPASWVSMTNFTTYESTKSFLNDYVHIGEGPDTFTRGYPYTIEYYNHVTNELLHQQVAITNENFFLSGYQDSRRAINCWKLNAAALSLDTEYNNLGINVTTSPEMGQVTKIFSSDIQDIKVDTQKSWKSKEGNTQSIEQDKSVPFWEDSIYLTPTIALTGDLVNEEDIYYKMEIIDSNTNIKLEDRVIKTVANEKNEIPLNLNTKDLIEIKNLSVNFYQLSFSEPTITDKVPITDTTEVQLFIEVDIFDSFKINKYPALFQWELTQANSKGVLERTADNETNLEILNSRFEETNWKVNLQINTSEELPFRFIWKPNNEEPLTVLEIGKPLPIMNHKSAQTNDGYNYSSNWESNYGLLIESDELIHPGAYGENINIVLTLENVPDFS